MGKVLATILVVLTFQAEVFSQSITWKDLEDVSFEEQYVDSYQDWFLVPTFGETVKKVHSTPPNPSRTFHFDRGREGSADRS